MLFFPALVPKHVPVFDPDLPTLRNQRIHLPTPRCCSVFRCLTALLPCSLFQACDWDGSKGCNTTVGCKEDGSW